MSILENDDDLSEDYQDRDQALHDYLDSVGWQGPDYEAFVVQAADYAHRSLRKLIRNREAFKRLDARGWPRWPTAREELLLQGTELHNLIERTVEDTVLRFQAQARRGQGWGGWRSTGGASLATWLVNGCVYELANSYDRWRRAMRPDKATLPLEWFAPELSEPPPETRVAEQDRLRRVFAKLSSQDREFLEDKYLKQMTHRQIADKWGITEKASERRLHRTKQHLRKLLQISDGDDSQ